ncbi:hypothetical protein [Enterobacter sp. ENT03]|uniref:hypothetical protein n=1 Tax=Enterobacter sp. ENT03 TaxID=2854780 RepID=UPI001C473126|nr:hypothetical protein [Enterobacter sp. ENT03]MBV7404104.1 hypothetical protein [Enterobacter sp. ENT03]
MTDTYNNASGSDTSTPALTLSTAEEMLGTVVMEMLRTGQEITRHGLCVKLAAKIDLSTDPALEAQLTELIGLVLKKG